MIFSTTYVPAFEQRPDKSRERSRVWEGEGFRSLGILAVLEILIKREGGVMEILWERKEILGGNGWERI